MATNKFITRAIRDKNIRAFEAKKGKIKRPLVKKPGKEFTREDIDRAMKPRETIIKDKIKKGKLAPLLKPLKKFQAEPETELIEALDVSYRQSAKYGDGLKKKGDSKRDSLGFYHARACPRNVYYDFFEPHLARPYTTKGLILFDDGKIHHKNIQQRLEEQRKLKHSEGFLHIPEINAKGYFDGLVPVEVDGDWIIVDIFELKSKAIGLHNVLDDDYDQGQLYHKAAQESPQLEALKYKVRSIRILYKDRSLMSDDVHKGWIIQPDLDRQKDIMEYMRFLWNVVYKEKKLFHHPYERKSNKCKYCKYHDHCWKGFKWEPEEADVSKMMEVETPTEEIVKTFAHRLHEIITEEKKLKAEKDTLIPALLKHFLATKTSSYPIADGEGLVIGQSKLTEWDVKGLVKAIGLEMFSKIGKPDSKKVTELIKVEHVDSSKFEQFKKYKLSKPSIRIGKVKE